MVKPAAVIWSNQRSSEPNPHMSCRCTERAVRVRTLVRGVAIGGWFDQLYVQTQARHGWRKLVWVRTLVRGVRSAVHAGTCYFARGPPRPLTASAAGRVVRTCRDRTRPTPKLGREGTGRGHGGYNALQSVRPHYSPFGYNARSRDVNYDGGPQLPWRAPYPSSRRGRRPRCRSRCASHKPLCQS